MKVIKRKLKTITRNQVTLNKIEDVVNNVNKLTIQVYDFIRLFLLNKYEKRELQNFILEDSDIKYIFSLLAIKNNAGIKSKKTDKRIEFDNFYDTEFKDLNKKVKYTNLSYILAYETTTILTSLSNNIELNYNSRICHYVRNKLSVTKLEAKKIMYDILKDDDNYSSDKKYHTWIKNNKGKLTIDNTLIKKLQKEKIDLDKKIKEGNKDLIDERKRLREVLKTEKKKNIMKLLDIQIFINKSLEENNKKLFQPISRRNSFRPMNIKIDNDALRTLFADKKGRYKKDRKDVKNKNSILWNVLFNIRVKKKGYVFAEMISTDGYSVSIYIIKSDKKNLSRFERRSIDTKIKEYQYLDQIQNINSLKQCKLIAVDPGKDNLIYMIDDKGNKLRYTSKQRYYEMGSKHFQCIRKKNKTTRIKEIEISYIENEIKTCNYEKFKNSLTERYKTLDEMLEFYKQDIYRSLNFRKYVNTQRSESNLVNRINKKFNKKKDREIVLLYGNWNRKSQMKYKHPTPNIGLKNRLNRDFTIYNIDEYKTSQLCNTCEEKMINVIDKRPSEEGKKIHRLLSCTNCNKIWNRDVNGSLNILKIGESIIYNNTIPECFKRSTNPKPSSNVGAQKKKIL